MSDVHFLSPVVVGQILDAAFMPQAYYVEMGCIAVILLEYGLTVTTELRVIWHRKLSIPIILFLLNRYFLLLWCLDILLWGFVFWNQDSNCQIPGTAQFLLAMLLQAINAVFLGLRIHAINNRRWFWTAVIVLLAVVEIPPNFVLMLGTRYVAVQPGFPFGGCAISKESLDYGVPAWQKAAIAVSVNGYVVNILVIGITWYRTARVVFEARRVKISASFSYYLLRDGTTYFLTNLIGNSIMIYIEVKRNISLGVVVVTIQSILMSRFILNLRMIDRTQTLPTISGSPFERSEELRFTHPRLDNLGAPLDVEEENERAFHASLHDYDALGDAEDYVDEGVDEPHPHRLSNDDPETETAGEYHALHRDEEGGVAGGRRQGDKQEA